VLPKASTRLQEPASKGLVFKNSQPFEMEYFFLQNFYNIGFKLAVDFLKKSSAFFLSVLSDWGILSPAITAAVYIGLILKLYHFHQKY